MYVCLGKKKHPLSLITVLYKNSLYDVECDQFTALTSRQLI